jgi:hypothetical protein
MTNAYSSLYADGMEGYKKKVKEHQATTGGPRRETEDNLREKIASCRRGEFLSMEKVSLTFSN